MRTFIAILNTYPRKVRVAGSLALAAGIDLAFVWQRFDARLNDPNIIDHGSGELIGIVAICLVVIVGALIAERAIFQNQR